MSEDALAKHIEERVALRDSAPPPTDPEVRELSGTVRLAQAVLESPAPPEQAERESRERVVSQLKASGPLTNDGESKGFVGRLKSIFRRNGS
jgi:hypothetical protein